MKANTLKQWSEYVIKRDGYKCRVCGDKNVKLQAHHIVPRFADKSIELDTRNGIALCGLCHIAAHTTKKAMNRKYEMHADELEGAGL